MRSETSNNDLDLGGKKEMAKTKKIRVRLKAYDDKIKRRRDYIL